MNANLLRMPLDILMTILSVILMGGTVRFLRVNISRTALYSSL